MKTTQRIVNNLINENILDFNTTLSHMGNWGRVPVITIMHFSLDPQGSICFPKC